MVIGLARRTSRKGVGELYFKPEPAFLQVRNRETGEHVTSIWREWSGDARFPTVVFKGNEYQCYHSNIPLFSLKDYSQGLFIKVPTAVLEAPIDRDILRQEVMIGGCEYFDVFVKGYGLLFDETPSMNTPEGTNLLREETEWQNLYENSKWIPISQKRPWHAEKRIRPGFLRVVNADSGLDTDYVQRRIHDGKVVYRGIEYTLVQLGYSGNCIKVPEVTLRSSVSVDTLVSEIISKEERELVVNQHRIYPRLLMNNN